MSTYDNLSISEMIEVCLQSVINLKKERLNRDHKLDLDPNLIKNLKFNYKKHVLTSSAEPKHLIYIFKINEMLNLVIELFDLPHVKTKLAEWFNPKEHDWKLFIFKTMILMSDEINMMLEQNWQFSSLAKVRQYFELYALYYLTSKYGAHVFDYFLQHGVNNMTKFIKCYMPNYELKTFNHQAKLSTQQIKSPYGWMKKIKQMDNEDHKIKHIIQKAIKDDEFLQHIYLYSNFPHHASSFMFASYIVKEETKALQQHTKKMVFHTYLWLLNFLVKNILNTFKNNIKNHQSDEFKKFHQLFKVIDKYIAYVKYLTSDKYKKMQKSDYFLSKK